MDLGGSEYSFDTDEALSEDLERAIDDFHLEFEMAADFGVSGVVAQDSAASAVSGTSGLSEWDKMENSFGQFQIIEQVGGAGGEGQAGEDSSPGGDVTRRSTNDGYVNATKSSVKSEQEQGVVTTASSGSEKEIAIACTSAAERDALEQGALALTDDSRVLELNLVLDVPAVPGADLIEKGLRLIVAAMAAAHGC